MNSTQLHSIPEDPKESLLVFPCSFVVKAMGRAEGNFVALVTDIVSQHVPNLASNAVKTRPSKAGNFTAVTATFTATSREQLDAIYYALSAHPDVLMAL
jgi:putative lipoic acid-binding regulatory protein